MCQHFRHCLSSLIRSNSFARYSSSEPRIVQIPKLKSPQCTIAVSSSPLLPSCSVFTAPIPPSNMNDNVAMSTDKTTTLVKSYASYVRHGTLAQSTVNKRAICKKTPPKKSFDGEKKTQRSTNNHRRHQLHSRHQSAKRRTARNAAVRHDVQRPFLRSAVAFGTVALFASHY